MKTTLLFLIILVNVSVYCQESMIVWDRQVDFKSYTELLKESLKITKGPDVNIRISRHFEQGEVVDALIDGEQVHIAVFAPNKKREKELIPIYFPLNRGILGLRICIINPVFQKLFAKIKTLSDFKKFGVEIVTGSFWSDNRIYEDHGLKLTTSTVYADLFSLLTKKKPRCFSRSINELEFEMKKVKEFGLVVDKNLLIQYNLPTFFFVSPKKEVLANRIKVGMKKIFTSEKLNKVFWKHNKSVFKRYNVLKRSIIYLKNSNLSRESSFVVADKKVWIPSLLKSKETSLLRKKD